MGCGLIGKFASDAGLSTAAQCGSGGQPRPLAVGSWPEKQPFSWRRLRIGDAFQPAARAGGHAGASELRVGRC
eukprot:7387678-Prymnesium_polylepis.1